MDCAIALHGPTWHRLTVVVERDSHVAALVGVPKSIWVVSVAVASLRRHFARVPTLVLVVAFYCELLYPPPYLSHFLLTSRRVRFASESGGSFLLLRISANGVKAVGLANQKCWLPL